MFGHELFCAACNETHTIRSCVMYRCVIPGWPIQLGANPIWCFDCNAVRDGEMPPPTDYAEAKIGDLDVNGIDLDEYRDKVKFLKLEFDPARVLKSNLPNTAHA